MATITHTTYDDGERDFEEWTCSKHGYICTTTVGADVDCPECEAESNYDDEGEERNDSNATIVRDEEIAIFRGQRVANRSDY